jgi:hypothetical protein
MSNRFIRYKLIISKVKSLKERAKEGSIAHARSILGKVPNRKPLYKEDEL